MARATIGKAFKISKKQVKGYGYAKPRRSSGYKKNPPPVSAIAAINGRGAYRRRVITARQAMRGLSANRRRARAKSLTRGERSAFASRMAAAKKRKESVMLRNRRRRRRRATPAQLRALARGRATQRRKRSGRMSSNVRRRRRLRRNTWPGQSRRHSKAAKKGWSRRRAAPKRRRRAAPKRRMRTNRRKTVRRRTRRAAPRRRLRRNASRRRVVRRKRRAAPRRRLRRNVSRKRSAAAKKGWRKRRARGLRKNTRRRTRRSSARRRLRRNASRRRTTRRRRATGRRRLRRNVSRKRSAAARKGWRSRRARGLRKNTRRTRRRTRRAAPRRRRRMSANRRRRTTRRRRYGRNSRRGMFRRNQGIKTTLLNALKLGGLVVVGLAAEKALAKVVSDYVVDRVLGSPTVATSGLGSALAPYRNVIGGLLAATAGILAANMLIKKAETKTYIIAGMAGGVLHTVLVTALERVGQSTAANYLSGYEDATAARLSAMYGYGDTSIQPMYAPIQGMGAVPYEAAAGVGMGEYFESGVEGLGNYTANPEMQQAAAGYGALPEYQGTHINPTSDLDAQLSIAEAAAGVGVYPGLQQAAAGVGEYFENPNAPMMGLGEFMAPTPGGGVASVPASSTWVPGTSDPRIWAGTKAITRPQGATASTPGGVLSTQGGSGVFG